MLQYLLATNSIDFIAGDFNYDLLRVSQNKLLDNFTDHVQLVNKPTLISGSLIDHFYIKKALWENFLLMQLLKTFIFQIIRL